MQESKHASFGKYTNIRLIFIFIISALLFIGLSMNNAHANFESTDSSSNGMCPADHKMYYIGANAPTSTTTFPVTAIPLSWIAGSSTGNFTFNETSGKKTFNINFSSILDKNSSEGILPFFGSIPGATTSAINLSHESTTAKTNHVMDVSINRSVSKTGYKIQDLDSVTVTRFIFGFFPVQRTPYIEQADVSANNGRLSFDSAFHTANNPAPNTSIVTAIEGRNCATGECTIDAAWNYKPANSPLSLKHNNTFSETNSDHTVGYSDFYFCLAPPKVIIKKQLEGARVNPNDQFEIITTQGTTTPNRFTTTGSGTTVTNDSSPVITLKESTSYTVTERVINGTTLGDIANYNATYTCNNATTGSTTVMPTATMAYNSTTKTRAFTLADTTYGDEITCTITNANAPKPYTFSGTVFNDNAGLSLTTDEINNVDSKYFNGILNKGELGIYNSKLKVSLTDCDSNTLIITSLPNPQTVSSTGQYSFNVPQSSLAVGQMVCLTENEPDSWDYSIDTTSNKREVKIINGNYIYDNLDFGEVKANNTALVLKKTQYVHTCNVNLNYLDATINQSTSDPTIGFSDQPVSDITPDQCIAYRVVAYNRGHVELKEVEITDPLQSIKSSFSMPVPKGDPATIYTSNALPTTNKIISNKFSLRRASDSATKATLYFNSKYSTTASK
ncbi:hypothetical protein H4W00_002031 [Psychrobacter sp. PL19]|uniref:hypothetical protein n=1 Tax=Psychrobacter sp. PL19 TaxID=2760711 RepID=UPI001AE400AD